MVLMTCCNTRYATVVESMNHTCPVEAIEMVAAGAGAARVMVNGERVGYANRIHGFIHFVGERRSALEGVKVCIASTDSTFIALERAIREGLVNGRDDRN